MIKKYLITSIILAIFLGYVSFENHYNNFISLGLPAFTYFLLILFLHFQTKKDISFLISKTAITFFGIWFISYTLFFNFL